MANEYAPEGKIWICPMCGKRSPDRYGFDKDADHGYDESCMLNAVLISIPTKKGNESEKA